MSAHRTMQIQPSRWHWDKTKDLFHLYFMVGMIPIGLTILYTNIFIGHAQLAPIPEGYRPEEWEYHRVNNIIFSLSVKCKTNYLIIILNFRVQLHDFL